MLLLLFNRRGCGEELSRRGSVRMVGVKGIRAGGLMIRGLLGGCWLGLQELACWLVGSFSGYVMVSGWMDER